MVILFVGEYSVNKLLRVVRFIVSDKFELRQVYKTHT